ncbi:hypothetical protein BGZ75_004646 [Mortierella antarctica]|nr:hypothetical protein BGZ75_004646 [Mortierella antarctica]
MLDWQPNHLFIRVAVEQLFWLFAGWGFESFLIGIICHMPVTKHKGNWAVYEPESFHGCEHQRPIHVLMLSPKLRIVFLVLVLLYPAMLCTGLAIAAAVLYDSGHYHLSMIMTTMSHLAWALGIYSLVLKCLYYGVKCTVLLRANIIVSEAAVQAPRLAFGVGDPKSPARYLLTMLQITFYGGAVVFLIAGLAPMSFAIFRNVFLGASTGFWPHTFAVLWTCTLELIGFIAMALFTVQAVRSRRERRKILSRLRNRQENSTSEAAYLRAMKSV